jgi:hypothetical protein
VQLIGPPDEAGQLTSLSQIPPRVRVDEDLSEVGFTGRQLKGVGRQEVDSRRPVRGAGRRDGVEDEILRHVLLGDGDLIIEWDSFRSAGDDIEIAIQPIVQRLGVEDHKPRARKQHQSRCGEKAHPEM